MIMGAIIGFAAAGGGFDLLGEHGCPLLPSEMLGEFASANACACHDYLEPA